MPTAVSHSQVCGARSPGSGRPTTTTTPTNTVSRMAQNEVAADMRRRSTRAESNSVSMRESTRTGCTTSREPNASATAWKPYAASASARENHQAGRLRALSGESFTSPWLRPARKIWWRQTVPTAIRSADVNAKPAAR